MYKIRTMNVLSAVIHTQLSADMYTVSAEEPVPDGILVRSASLHEMPFEPGLLAIARAGAGVNNIPVDACSKAGIVVFNTPGANANAVAELVTAGLLLSGRNIAGGIAWAQGLKGQGETVPKLVEKGKGQFVGAELRGKTLGVIGLGAIGALVANAASRGLGMKVIGFDPFISVESAWSLSSRIRRASSMEEVLARADFVTLHIPLNDQTKGIVGAAFLRQMKPGTHLLNFSRAELCDGAEVRRALTDRHLSSYVTDFPTEDMLGVEKAVCIPHLGASTPESEENCARMAAAELRDYLEYGSIRNSVNLPELPLSPPEAARILVLHENIPNMVATISACISREKINIDNMTNKSRKAMAVTVMETPLLPTEESLAALSALPGVIRVRTFQA